MSSRGLTLVALFWASCVLLYGQAGPANRQKVDPDAAQRGRALYLQYCINCHGTLARGTDQGPDLMRSVPV
ncbi:MAG TPA: hypothetical protein VG297_07175, partial [Bryobacteraceae bacterium]|nr:hypothetical protein [Bryobacteraceae bacterium]